VLPLSINTLRGAVFYFPEEDLACGPGSYRIAELRLALSSARGSAATPTVLV
jgi:hypothetical protein